MLKALILIIIVGGLVWLGLLEDQHNGRAPVSSAFLGKLTGEHAKEELNESSNSADADSDSDSDSDSHSDDNASNASKNIIEATTETAEQSLNVVTDAVDAATGSIAASVESSVESTEQSVASITEEVSTQPLSLSGLSRKIGGALGTTTSLLSGITDEASATAALPKLTTATQSLSAAATQIPDIPDAAKAPLSKLINGGMEKIKPLADTAFAIPGVEAVLQPVIGPMMETLSGLRE